MRWMSNFTFLAIALILATDICMGRDESSSSEGRDESSSSESRDDSSSSEGRDTSSADRSDRDCSSSQNSRESRKSSEKSWLLSDPELMIKNGKLHVTLRSSRKIKWARFYMSVNTEFSRFRDAEYVFELRCKRKVCRKSVGPILQEGEVVYYGVVAKIKGRRKRQTILGLSWTPFTTTTTTTGVPPTTPVLPTTGSCSALADDLPAGCLEHLYEVPNGFPSNNGRGNPERGFYKYTECKASFWTPAADEPLSQWVDKGHTLIYRIYILDEFVNANISDDVLEKIKEDFAAIRNAGIKVILRFSYSIDIDVIDDAAPAQLMTHIQQLAPLLEEAGDVIAVMHTGFIGVWGEWYYTANYGNEGDISDEDYENRRQVVFELLEALPESRQIQLRYPAQKRIILGRTSSVTSDEAYTDAKVARIGHHNDCFLASSTDYGTYVNKEEEYPYLQNETLFVVQGGETCNSNRPRSDCATALKELSELHYTYLNTDYHPKVLQSWKDQGCYNQIGVSLGYRLVGVSSRAPEAVAKGSSFTLGVTLRNIGWAAPISKRSAQLVMIHKITEEEHQSALEDDLDLRECQPGDHSFDLTLSVPASATTGEYEVLLKLPDGEESLMNRPEYNIVMENLENEGDLESRLNLLCSITVI